MLVVGELQIGARSVELSCQSGQLCLVLGRFVFLRAEVSDSLAQREHLARLRIGFRRRIRDAVLQLRMGIDGLFAAVLELLHRFLRRLKARRFLVKRIFCLHGRIRMLALRIDRFIV